MPAIYQYGKNFTAGGNIKERTLTQAEYDALSYADQHNGTTYYITDAPTIGVATEETDGLMSADDKVTLMTLASAVGEPEVLEEVPYDTVTEAVKTLALTVGEPEVLEEVPYDTVTEAVKEVCSVCETHSETIGETDISSVGDGTITGAILSLSENSATEEDTELSLELIMDTTTIDTTFNTVFGEEAVTT